MEQFKMAWMNRNMPVLEGWDICIRETGVSVNEVEDWHCEMSEWATFACGAEAYEWNECRNDEERGMTKRVEWMGCKHVDCGEGFFIVNCNLLSEYAPGKNSTQEKQPWARRLGSGCNEWSVAEWFADTDQASRAACEWSKGGAKRWFEGTKTLCSICAKWNDVFWGGFREGNTAWNENTRLQL